MNQQFPEMSKLIPHRKTMCLVDQLLTSDGHGNGSVKAIIKKNLPYFVSGKFLSHWFIEIMAQAVAAQAGYETILLGGPIRVGYLITIDEYRLLEENVLIVPNDELLIETKIENDMKPVAFYSTSINFRGKTIVQAKMKFVIETKGVLS